MVKRISAEYDSTSSQFLGKVIYKYYQEDNDQMIYDLIFTILSWGSIALTFNSSPWNNKDKENVLYKYINVTKGEYIRTTLISIINRVFDINVYTYNFKIASFINNSKEHLEIDPSILYKTVLDWMFDHHGIFFGAAKLITVPEFFNEQQIGFKMVAELNEALRCGAFYNIDNDTFLSFQHYSKVLDLTSIRDTPYNDIPDTENNLGEKYRAATSLDEFGYGDIDKYLDSYPVIVGNQYPCMVYQSIKSKLKIPVEEVLRQFRNILINFNNSLFSVHMFDKYCNSNYQYWRGGPLIAKNSVFKKLLSFTIDFEHAFLDNKSYSDSSIYVLKDRRENGYIGEIIMGFAIYCYIEDCKKQGKKIGYCRLLTDSNVVYGSTRR